MSDAQIYDAVIAKAVADAYDRGYAAGRDIGYDAGFLAACKTEVIADVDGLFPAGRTVSTAD